MKWNLKRFWMAQALVAASIGMGVLGMSEANARTKSRFMVSGSKQLSIYAELILPKDKALLQEMAGDRRRSAAREIASQVSAPLDLDKLLNSPSGIEIAFPGTDYWLRVTSKKPLSAESDQIFFFEILDAQRKSLTSDSFGMLAGVKEGECSSAPEILESRGPTKPAHTWVRALFAVAGPASDFEGLCSFQRSLAIPGGNQKAGDPQKTSVAPNTHYEARWLQWSRRSGLSPETVEYQSIVSDLEERMNLAFESEASSKGLLLLKSVLMPLSEESEEIRFLMLEVLSASWKAPVQVGDVVSLRIRRELKEEEEELIRSSLEGLVPVEFRVLRKGARK